MSPQHDNSANGGLSRTLQQSLQEVLMEVSMGDNFMGVPSGPPSLNPLLQQNMNLNRPQGLNFSAFSMAGLGHFNGHGASSNANALAALGGAGGMGNGNVNTNSFFSQVNSNGLAAFQGSGSSNGNNSHHLRPSEALGMSTEELLLAAATEKRMLEQAQQRMAARQQSLAEKTLESRRRYQESLLALMKGPSNKPTTSLLGVANPNGLLQQGLLNQFKVQPQQVPASVGSGLVESQSKTAIKVLGNSLRKKDSPYLDVSCLNDPDVSDKRTRGGVTEPFPEKLHRMLEEVKKDGKDDVISFFSHGRAFAVHDPDRFTSEVMPKYFKQSRLSSFQRQLNLYGFTRITSGPDAGGYYHELFLSGRPSLAVHMRRVGLPKGEDRRKMRAKNQRSEPNFYAMCNVKDAKVTIPGLH